MNIKITFSRLCLLLLLASAFGASPVYAEEALAAPIDAASEATAGEEAVVPADVPASKQELMQQAADGDVAQPRVRKFMKPNRSQLHQSVTNQKSGYGFLDENQRKPGVVKLKNGLQYKVLKPGAGAKPTENDVVKCQYKGSLIDGTVFEQSAAGSPSNIKVSALIPGLKEALKLMPVGSKWQVFLPPDLGFGLAGKAPKVGPDAVLIYDLELLAVNAAAR